MILEILQKEKNKAILERDNWTRDVISGMIDAIQKASITPKGRIEITEQLVNDTLIKYQKTIQEMVDTCPDSRSELKAQYERELNLVKLYAPQLLTDPVEISNLIKDALNGEIELTKANKGKIMKTISPILKGKADMKIVNQIIGEMLV